MLSNFFLFASRVLSSNVGRLKFPYKLTFVVTKKCHSRCLNCNIWKQKPVNELKLDEIMEFARNSPFLSWVDFTGGEPTDRADFTEIVRSFAEACPHLVLVHFPTNGLKPGRTLEVTREIARMGIPRLMISVSIDGPPEINDKLRGIPGDFDKACETLGLLKEVKGAEVCAGMTLYRENVSLVDATIKAISGRLPWFSRSFLHVNIPNTSEHYYQNADQGLSQLADIREDILKAAYAAGNARLSVAGWLERSYQSRIASFYETGRCPLPCASMLSSVYLSENGTVYPCIAWNRPLGNIRDSGYSLVPIINSGEYRNVRAEVEQERCPHCWTPCEAYQTILANILPQPCKKAIS